MSSEDGSVFHFYSGDEAGVTIFIKLNVILMSINAFHFSSTGWCLAPAHYVLDYYLLCLRRVGGLFSSYDIAVGIVWRRIVVIGLVIVGPLVDGIIRVVSPREDAPLPVNVHKLHVRASIPPEQPRQGGRNDKWDNCDDPTIPGQTGGKQYGHGEGGKEEDRHQGSVSP